MSHHRTECVAVHRLYCRSWQCEDCRPRRLRMLRDLAAAGQPCTLITLTSNPNEHESPDDAARALVHAWRMTCQRARREGLAAKIPYLAVFEETRRGWPHLHILARAPYIPHDWLSERLNQYAGAPIVDIRRVYNRRHASRYVAKYVSKGPGRFEGCKRYWRSQDYQLSATGWERDTPVHDAEHWYHPVRLEAMAEQFEAQDYRVEWDGEHAFTAYPADRYCLPPTWQAWTAAGRGPPHRERR